MNRACLMGVCLGRARRRWLVIGMGLVALAACSAVLMGQQPAGGKTPSTATVTFTLDFPGSDPEHYSIAVDANGHGRYEATSAASADSEKQSYETGFEVSGASREKIFEWVKQAHFFAGNIDSGNRKLAFTGAKILSYQDGERNNTARYDYSNLAAVRDLTTLFQSMAATLGYGQRLTYDHRYQKLALDDELKRMEAEAKSNALSELQCVAPMLQEIVDDNSVMNVVRVRARALLQSAGRTSAQAGHNEH